MILRITDVEFQFVFGDETALPKIVTATVYPDLTNTLAYFSFTTPIDNFKAFLKDAGIETAEVQIGNIVKLNVHV